MTDPTSTLAPMDVLYRAFDAEIEALLVAYAEAGYRPSCRRGCSACCHQLVMTTYAEARVAAAAFRRWAPEARAAFEDRLASWLDRTAELRRELQGLEDSALEAGVEAIAERYWLLRPPCPFLVDEACAIHPDRPLVCRHLFSLSDPAQCQTNDQATVERMEDVEDLFFEAQDGIPEAEAAIGMLPELVALVLAESASA